jgi:TPR repeat protein
MDTLFMEGDGQVYLTCPLDLIWCGDAELERLLRDVDAQAHDAPRLARAYVAQRANDDMWVHEELVERGLEAPIRAVLEGRADRLALPTKFELRLAAERGDPIACYNLGRKLGQAGRAWLVKAARRGHLGAMEALGDVGWLEQLVQSDPSPERLRRACNRLSVLAERAGDLAAAIAWLERVGPGDYTSLRLGRLYQASGDRPRAVAWLEAATARGQHSDLRLDDFVGALRELERLR